MGSDSTERVIEHHGAALAAGDVDGVMEDYTDDSVFISNLGGVLKGIDAIRPVFELAGDLAGHELTATHIEGEAAYVAWKADGIAFASDTFVVRDGKIVLQTVAILLA